MKERNGTVSEQAWSTSGQRQRRFELESAAGKRMTGRDKRQKVKWRKRHSWNNKADGGMEVENKRK